MGQRTACSVIGPGSVPKHVNMTSPTVLRYTEHDPRTRMSDRDRLRGAAIFRICEAPFHRP